MHVAISVISRLEIIQVSDPSSKGVIAADSRQSSPPLPFQVYIQPLPLDAINLFYKGLEQGRHDIISSVKFNNYWRVLV